MDHLSPREWKNRNIKTLIQELTKQITKETTENIVRITQSRTPKDLKQRKYDLQTETEQHKVIKDHETNSRRIIQNIIKTLENYFRKPKKNHINNMPLETLTWNHLKNIYNNTNQIAKKASNIKKGVTIPARKPKYKTNQLSTTIQQQTFEGYKKILMQYKDRLLKALKLTNTVKNPTVQQIREYHKRAHIQDIIDKNQITDPNTIENFKIFGPKITAKDVQEYYQTIKHQEFNLQDRIKKQTKKNQQDFKIQAIIKKALGDKRETCLERLKNEEELKKRYNTYFQNNEVTIEQFKTYLEKEKEKKEKKALKEKKQQLTPDKIDLLNQRFEKISKKDLLKNKDTYSNKLKKRGISKTQFEIRLERRKRDNEEVASSCKEKANKLIEQFEDTFRQRTKYLKIENRKTPYKGKITFNDDYKEEFKTSIVEQRKKEGDPQGSQWENALQSYLTAKIKTPLLVQKNGKHYIMSLHDIKLILKITIQGMEIVNILPRKLTIKPKTTN